MKKNILIVIILIVGFILISQTVGAVSTPVGAKECPAGTFLVTYEDNDFQKPICKGEPTGCPYGDQIPVDSPKCVPPVELQPIAEVESTTPEYVLTPDGGMKNTQTGEVFYGK